MQMSVFLKKQNHEVLKNKNGLFVQILNTNIYRYVN